MTAYNVVRFRVRPGQEKAFIEAHERAVLDAPGLRKAAIVATGDRRFCFVGEWDDMESIAGARPAMVAILDTFRPLLEDLGDGLGLTDPVSGLAVIEIRQGRAKAPA
ncbi:MAG: antibiotic biosynthesis monooxygenase [Amaricoccus sp.]|uniref:putative quinol monooxygenase n=1 Tax=Amaricoccus sp. TaxID=1872485 RepID=UPI003315B883